MGHRRYSSRISSADESAQRRPARTKARRGRAARSMRLSRIARRGRGAFIGSADGRHALRPCSRAAPGARRPEAGEVGPARLALRGAVIEAVVRRSPPAPPRRGRPPGPRSAIRAARDRRGWSRPLSGGARSSTGSFGRRGRRGSRPAAMKCRARRVRRQLRRPPPSSARSTPGATADRTRRRGARCSPSKTKSVE